MGFMSIISVAVTMECLTQPLCVVNYISDNSFRTNNDKFWCSQDIYCDYKCDIAGTGNRSVSNKYFYEYTD